MALNDRVGQLGTFCALTPIADVDAVRAELEAWGTGPASPLARVPHVHFGRFVVIAGLARQVARQPADDLPPHLMASAFFDGPEPDVLLDGLCREMPDAADRVWRHCHGYPGHPARHGAAFRAWLEAHRVPATQIFAAYSHATVAQVRSALALRNRLRAFIQDLDARRLDEGPYGAFARGEAP